MRHLPTEYKEELLALQQRLQQVAQKEETASTLQKLERLADTWKDDDSELTSTALPTLRSLEEIRFGEGLVAKLLVFRNNLWGHIGNLIRHAHGSDDQQFSHKLQVVKDILGLIEQRADVKQQEENGGASAGQGTRVLVNIAEVGLALRSDLASLESAEGSDWLVMHIATMQLFEGTNKWAAAVKAKNDEGFAQSPYPVAVGTALDDTVQKANAAVIDASKGHWKVIDQKRGAALKALQAVCGGMGDDLRWKWEGNVTDQMKLTDKAMSDACDLLCKSIRERSIKERLPAVKEAAEFCCRL